MTTYDDSYQHQLDYERDLEQQEYERQLRLEEQERQHQLEEEKQRESKLEQQALAEEQALFELRQQQQQEDAQALANDQDNKSGTSGRQRNSSWNWHWARRSREQEYRRVREDDEKRWYEQRHEAYADDSNATPSTQRSFIYPLFAAVLLVGLGFALVSIFGLFNHAPATDDLPLMDASLSVDSELLIHAVDRIDEVVEAVKVLQQHYARLEQTPLAIDVELKALRDHVTTLQEKQSTQLAQTQQSLTILEKQLADLPALVKEQPTLRLAVGQLTTAVDGLKPVPSAVLTTRQTESQEQPTLPFQLVAIDYWNNVAYAAISYRDQLEKAAVGDSLAGWQVAAIDAEQQRVVFQRNDRQLAQTITR